ncbi:MAG: LysE family translocator [Porticoccaceae bacterium]|nr:LysE family translocator [Porticoccaceae bacterium]
MTIASALALYSTMIVLALIPGPGVIVVVARALDSGFRQGLATAMGVLSGDFVFITLTVFGLAALAELMGNLFVVIKYIGAAYLIYMGFTLITAKPLSEEPQISKPVNHSTNFLVGLMTSISNPKVVLFYFSFFPAFIDLDNLSLTDVAALFFIAIFSVGTVMAGYAYVAAKTKSSFAASPKTRYLKLGSGALLIGGGVFIALRN